MTDINAKHLDGAGLSHVFGKIKGALDNRMNDSVEFLYRAVSETEGAPSGLATIDSIHGNTLRWNQLCTGQDTEQVVGGITRTATASGGITLAGTVTTAPDYNQLFLSNILFFKRDGRKYLIKASKDVGIPLRITGYVNSGSNRAFIWSDTASSNWGARVAAYAPVGTELNVTDLHISVFDLTAMFGAGNEPATVAEFEALFPEPYYPYDPGSLLPVRMEGVETVAADESWTYQRTIHAATYFPRGMRSAGTVYDELRADAAVTRVGAVTFDGSSDESWGVAAIGSGYRFSSKLTNAVESNTPNRVFAECNRLDLLLNGGTGVEGANGFHISSAGYFLIALNTLAPSVTTVEQLRAWLAQNPLTLHYALATPTTTPIDPPLALRYKVDSDGTERIMVDERKDAPQSAPVPMDVTYGISLYGSAVDDGMNIAHVRDVVGEPNSPYTEVEWVESNGTQYVYLDWKPPVATWGFEADFISKNATGTSVAAWRSDTNVNGYASVFGTRNASHVNDAQLASYSAGRLLTGGQTVTSIGWSRNNRVVMKLHGTTFTKPDGTTLTVSRGSETANKPYANMTVFCCHEGLRRSGTGNLIEGSTTRIYSLKFYDGTTLKVNLVGAIRNRDGMTGLYDKVKRHFYPAQGMTYGDAVGTLGEPDTVEYGLLKRDIITYVDNRTNTRMLNATVPELASLEDGQQLTVIYSAAITSSTQTTELAGWDDTSSNSNLYLKVTLADGSKTEWIPCYYANGSRLTSHYGAGTPIRMTYRENVFYNATTTSAGTAVMRGWWADPSYNSDDVYTRYSDTLLAGLNGVKRYSLNMRDVNGNWTSIMNEDNNANATGKTAYTGGLMLGNVLYHNSGSVIAAGGNTGQMCESRGGIDFRFDVNGVTSAAATTELQLRKPVYLVGTVHSDGLFYLDQTKWWTQTSFETGKVYVHVGTAYSSYYAIFLSVNNPTYVWNGTRLIEFSPVDIGGRNLLRHTTHPELKGQHSQAIYDTEGWYVWGTPSDFSRTNEGIKGSFNINGTGFVIPFVNDDIVSGETDYILSFDARGTFTGPTTAYALARSGSNWQTNELPSLSLSETEWTHVEIPVRWPSFGGRKARAILYPYTNTSGKWIEIRDSSAKFEKGTKATDWSPAPEDVQSDIANIEVGGRNFLKNTAYPTDANKPIPIGEGITWGGVTNVTLSFEAGVMKLTSASTSGEHYVRLNSPSHTQSVFEGMGVDVHDKLVLSGFIRASISAADGYVTVRSEPSTGSNWTNQITLKNLVTGIESTGTSTVTILNGSSSEWVRFAVLIFIPESVTAVNEYFSFQQYGTFTVGDTIELKRLKLERGTMPTDWTPAPEDFDSRITEAESKLSGIAAGAEVNQNAFSNVKVGSTTVAADAKTDTLELAGSNVTLTPDATNDKVTIGITASNVTTALGTLPVANGGTGQTSLAAARNAMGLGNTTGALPVANGGTGATSAANARTNLGVPPTSHASSATTYGTGTDANYGHVKLSGATNSTSGTSGGIAATPSAVKTAYDLANTANGTANTALSGVNGTLIYDHTYTIANGVATFTAHVYCKGEEVTSQYADSAFSWSYRLSNAISETGTPSVVSLGTGKTKTINITTLGLGGHVIGTFTTD